MAGISEKTYLSLLESGQYSDFTIACGNVKFQVHRMIICSESDMFTAACNGNFKEATDSLIDLSEENPSIVSRVLLFLYTSEYDASKLPEFIEQWGVKDGALSELEVHSLVYKVADMLGMKPLKRYASAKVVTHLNSSSTWSNEFANPLRALYENTRTGDEDLRYPTTMFLIANYQQVLSQIDVLKVVEEHEPLLWRACLNLTVTATQQLNAANDDAAKELARVNKKAKSEIDKLQEDLEQKIGTIDKLKNDLEWKTVTRGQIWKSLQEKCIQCCHGKKIGFEYDPKDELTVTLLVHSCQKCLNGGLDEAPSSRTEVRPPQPWASFV